MQEQHQTIQTPTPNEQDWPTVREHLSKARGIPTRLLDACKGRGILYADYRHNAIFRCTDTARRTTRAEILGTQTTPSRKAFKAMARGSRKARGAFWIPASNRRPNTLFLADLRLRSRTHTERRPRLRVHRRRNANPPELDRMDRSMETSPGPLRIRCRHCRRSERRSPRQMRAERPTMPH